MPPTPSKTLRGHTGKTGSGHTRDIKVDRIGRVTIYKRGMTFWLYYRENGQTRRYPVEGNLAVARASAAKATAAIEEQRPTPLGFQRTTPADFAAGYLNYVENVQGLAWRTVDRYRAALDRFQAFCTDTEIASVDAVDEHAVEDFVRWLRGQTRTRNGMAKGKRDSYKVGGIKFILSTCRTTYNWAARHRMLPPYTENPFSRFPIDSLRDPGGDDEGQHVFTEAQEQAFLKACSEWQRSLFTPLVSYGMRVGELTHLLIENVDFKAGTLEICSKPEVFWRVKTARRRKLPLTVAITTLLKQLIGERKAGFVFLNQAYFEGAQKPAAAFSSDRAFRKHLEQVASDVLTQNPAATKKERRQAVVSFCRSLGQVPTRRVLQEFCKLTTEIGCPEFTRVHDLRHLFTTRAQEMGANPLVVQEIVGHRSLDMTRRYSHPGMSTKLKTIELVSPPAPPTKTTP